MKIPAKRLFAMFLMVVFLLTACNIPGKKQDKEVVKLDGYEVSWFDYFDTIIKITAYTESEESFEKLITLIESEIKIWNKLLDPFRAFEGINTIYTLNHSEGKWISLDKRLMDVLAFSKEAYKKTNGQTNVAIGELSMLWHSEREQAASNNMQGKLPSQKDLENAAMHMDINHIELDMNNNQARLLDPDMQIDLGAVGKGYVTDYLDEMIRAEGYNSVLLNLGGNVKVIGKKSGKAQWSLGINNPFSDGTDPAKQLREVLLLEDLSVISSGNYERFYYVEDVLYHHIIDPDTLYPNLEFAQVSVVSPEAAWGDVLSTALFNMSIEDGLKVLEAFPDTAVFWIKSNGEEYKTDNWAKDFTIR